MSANASKIAAPPSILPDVYEAFLPLSLQKVSSNPYFFTISLLISILDGIVVSSLRL